MDVITNDNHNDFVSNRFNNMARPYFSREMLRTTPANLFNEYTIDLGKTVNFVAFSHFDNSTDILACGTQERVYVFRILFLSDNEDPNEELRFDYQFIHDYITGSKATSIAFNPKSDFSQAQNNLLNFAIAGDDFCILTLKQIINDDSTQDNCDQQLISGHTDYINDMAFEPISGDSLASASDDCTCCVWSLGNQTKFGTLEMKIQLSSPGINVKWHTSEHNKLFVSEKRGLIRFYDTNSHVAVMSFECNRYPLMSGDWCHDNSLFIGCISGKELFFWDTSLSSLPLKVIKTKFEGLSEFQFYDSKLIALRGRPNNIMQVKNFTNNQVYIEKEFVAGQGISWNRKLPILAVGGSKAIHIFKINTI